MIIFSIMFYFGTSLAFAQNYTVAYENTLTETLNVNSTKSTNVTAKVYSDKYIESILADKENGIISFSFKAGMDPNLFYQIVDNSDREMHAASVHSKSSENLDLVYDTHLLPPGVYFLNIRNKDFFMCRKFIKHPKGISMQ